VYTTFDPDVVAAARAAGETSVPDAAEHSTAALVATDPMSGAVRVAFSRDTTETVPVGEDEVATYNVNYGVLPQGPQPGSVFMIVVIAAALEQGVAPTDAYDGRGPCEFDEPQVEGGIWRVANLGEAPGQISTVDDLLTSSSFCGAIRISKDTGLDAIADIADRCLERRNSHSCRRLCRLGSMRSRPWRWPRCKQR